MKPRQHLARMVARKAAPAGQAAEDSAEVLEAVVVAAGAEAEVEAAVAAGVEAAVAVGADSVEARQPVSAIA